MLSVNICTFASKKKKTKTKNEKAKVKMREKQKCREIKTEPRVQSQYSGHVKYAHSKIL